MGRLIFDTGVLIAGARRRLDLSSMVDEDDVALPAVVVAKYLAGVQGESDREVAQRAFLDEVLAIVPVVDYDSTVAKHHAALLAHVRGTGLRHGPHDLINAAIARAADRVLISSDVKEGFDELPGVSVRLLDP